ncbi:MAG: bifunctional adenosylcobinamide kinase/adenosylcobinamide-phosphate guanylyltransferase [Hyphomicrobiales bacterium]|nr:MAG: bifunctional adenosylcobinamide kinase/adenosylcobinamide-phosphate guanylyltransferase [Hyphomicrobiales bacterium]
MSNDHPPRETASVLVVGGARSGKSRFAERLVADSGRERVYLATATPGDGEMADRIARHRARRDDNWLTVEEPLELVSALAREAVAGRAVLVDCVTLWLSNLSMNERDVEREVAALVDLIPRLDAAVVFVSNELGSGIVPANALARSFRDMQGRLNQALAEACERVVLVVAGQPLLLKPQREEIRL